MSAARYTAGHWGVHAFDAGGTRLRPFEGDPDPSAIGQGWAGAVTDARARILRPAIRRGWLSGDRGAARCDDAYVEVPWDEALDLAAGELRRVIAQHGNRAIYAGSYGWASAGRFHHAQSQLRRFLNLIGGYTGSRDTYSHAAAEVVLPYLVGQTNKRFEEGLTTWPSIAERCTLMLAFGGISTRTAQIASGGTSEHEVGGWMRRAAERGMHTLCVSPLASDVDAIPGLEWLPIRPGSDVALMMALTHEIVRQGAHDREFLARCTDGWAVYEAYLMGRSDGVAKSAEWAAPLCDLAPERIRALAERLPRERVMVSLAWGMQRADHGEQPIWAGLALACALGQIGRPGTGFGFGYGSTTMSGRPRRFVGWPSLPAGERRVLDFIPVARVADMLLNPGGAYTYDGQERTYPDVRLVHWAGGNPFHHHQDLIRLERAWRRPETVVVHDHSWTATARRADIVLPCTTPLEREDIMVNRRDPRLVAMSPMAPPMGEARDDHAILAGLAERMGVGAAFTEGLTTEGWLRRLWDDCREVARAEGLSLPDLETLRAEGVVEAHSDRVERIALGDFAADPEGAPLATESGRITIHSARIAALGLPDCAGHPTWYRPAEWTCEAPDVFHLVSNQPAARLHAQLDNGPVSAASKVAGREGCTMHPDAARRIGAAEGDVVLLENERGACLAGLRMRRDMREDCVVLPTGAWLDLRDMPEGQICVHGNPNVLTIDKGTSGLGQGNVAHTATVRVRRWEGPAPEVRAFEAPEMVPREGG